MTLAHRVALACCIALASILPAAAQDATGPVATATGLLDRLDAGEYETATVDFNAQMKAALGPEQLQGVQRQLEAMGAVQSRGEPQVSEHDGYTVVVVRIQRAGGAVDATVAIDGEGKVAGLHFAPAATDAK